MGRNGRKPTKNKAKAKETIPEVKSVEDRVDDDEIVTNEKREKRLKQNEANPKRNVDVDTSDSDSDSDENETDNVEQKTKRKVANNRSNKDDLEERIERIVSLKVKSMKNDFKGFECPRNGDCVCCDHHTGRYRGGFRGGYRGGYRGDNHQGRSYRGGFQGYSGSGDHYRRGYQNY